MIEVIDARSARDALVAGLLRCPSCRGQLRPWGRARVRKALGRDGVHTARPDRSRCRLCGTTHILLAAQLVARRNYTADVIGTALMAGGEGAGQRRVAVRLGVPAGTVRSWLRRARNNAQAVYRFGVEKVVVLNPALLPTTVRPTPLGNALNALVAAASAAADRFGLSVTDPWPLINAISQGRLLAPPSYP